MDFFAQQDIARRKSRAFITAFAGAVLLAVIIYYFVITAGLVVLGFWAVEGGSPLSILPSFFYGSPPEILAPRPIILISLALAAFIVLVSVFKTRILRGGGGNYAARLLGGEPLDETAADFKERRLLNLVEEMAVASGCAQPLAFIMPREEGINAITAGLDREDAVIVVTRGALRHLDREELQGVVAHEFAHILNGDCSLNLNMAGSLHGLLLFSTGGRKLASLAGRIEGRGSLPLMLIGLMFWLGGSAGRLSAELLQAAFSRQREYLADACAAQFTRRPAGLAGALKKIAALPRGGVLTSPQALMMKSFFLANPLRLAGLFRTHPPLEDRILALDPGWDGTPAVIGASEDSDEAAPAESPFSRPVQWPAVLAALDDGGTVEPLTTQNLAGARQVVDNLPGELRRAVDDPARVAALTAALFLPDDPAAVRRQLEIIRHFLGEEAAGAAAGFKPLLAEALRLPLLALAAPKLRLLPPEERRRLDRAARSLTEADGQLGPEWGIAPPKSGLAETDRPGTGSIASPPYFFEIAARRLLNKYLGLTNRSTEAIQEPRVIREDLYTVLSVMAGLSGNAPGIADEALAAGLARLPDWAFAGPARRRTVEARELAEALERLGRTRLETRRRLVRAAAEVAGHDRVVTRSEYDLLRALAAALELPLPLLPPGPVGEEPGGAL